jgi:hypothetical protein
VRGQAASHQGTLVLGQTVRALALSHDGSLAWSIGGDAAMVCMDLVTCKTRTGTRGPAITFITSSFLEVWDYLGSLRGYSQAFVNKMQPFAVERACFVVCACGRDLKPMTGPPMLPT